MVKIGVNGPYIFVRWISGEQKQTQDKPAACGAFVPLYRKERERYLELAPNNKL